MDQGECGYIYLTGDIDDLATSWVGKVQGWKYASEVSQVSGRVMPFNICIILGDWHWEKGTNCWTTWLTGAVKMLKKKKTVSQAGGSIGDF